MNAWSLPTSLTVGGVGFSIRTDFRVVLDIMSKLADPQYEDDEKALIVLRILYIDYDQIPIERHEEAVARALEFVDMGMKNDGTQKRPTTMDWEQDAPLIIPAVNKVLGGEVRSMRELHWWTFLSAYMEIGQSLFSSVLSVRQKKAKHKKLEKDEEEFYRENKALIDLHSKNAAWSDTEREELRALFGYKKKR